MMIKSKSASMAISLIINRAVVSGQGYSKLEAMDISAALCGCTLPPISPTDWLLFGDKMLPICVDGGGIKASSSKNPENVYTEIVSALKKPSLTYSAVIEALQRSSVHNIMEAARGCMVNGIVDEKGFRKLLKRMNTKSCEVKSKNKEKQDKK